ncbi:MAG: thioredoxin [Nitrospirae bacterium CG_4_9_14_3_um_filter_53_35]|nr:MAG: thioredoxin [Nitrospirae bacterium CG08_land_8_20_14_0_20_52_24]PIV85159.1 MAG: thioredoxin [Nitrospirae bacterium CG17_big_fil_post_rev_8_21_14_2_50_50_9]PIW84626.1 MAG: thioredoxin [Nitrospirae bacterium CG_4_8_14_3_um_filter_50_41]PIX85570.1 MAG: thioredoxin [Nitrospirae bacterium CG_4_10_14_3_um_filter_53_41]PJA74751.1 MAG: thioredoxin [Nitrospirae bacterium CG_4_9_14_3_um_filter_53_35]
MGSDKIVVLNDQNFKEEIKSSQVPILVDFWAEWCAPCRMIAPMLEEIAEEYNEKLKIGKLNVDQNRTIAAQYGVMSIPTLILFKDGEMVEQMIGAQPKENLLKIIKSAL